MKNILYCKVITGGMIENNKGIHLINRSIKLNFLTEKDKAAINLAKKMSINHYALSFTNTHKDILKFNINSIVIHFDYKLYYLMLLYLIVHNNL